jgi:hypothetical protein
MNVHWPLRNRQFLARLLSMAEPGWQMRQRSVRLRAGSKSLLKLQRLFDLAEGENPLVCEISSPGGSRIAFQPLERTLTVDSAGDAVWRVSFDVRIVTPAIPHRMLAARDAIAMAPTTHATGFGSGAGP